MERDKVTIVLVNPGSGGRGPPKITPDILYHGFGITFVWFCIDIKAFPVFHFKSLPKVWRTMIKPGVKFMD